MRDHAGGKLKRRRAVEIKRGFDTGGPHSEKRACGLLIRNGIQKGTERRPRHHP